MRGEERREERRKGRKKGEREEQRDMGGETKQEGRKGEGIKRREK